jgi:hypothetical protein
MYIGLQVDHLLFFSDFNETPIFLNRFSKNPNFMNIRPVGAELFHVDRHTED